MLYYKRTNKGMLFFKHINLNYSSPRGILERSSLISMRSMALMVKTTNYTLFDTNY